MKKLKKRWGIESNFQFAVIFIVFALTGSASAWLSKPVCFWLGITKEDLGFLFTPVRLLIIFPVYQPLLILMGFLFGQSKFFMGVVKRMITGMGLGFLFRKA